jgi:hypothetical protein
MESVGRLHHPQPSASDPATHTPRSNADGRYDRRFSRAQTRRRAGSEKLVARHAVPRHHDRQVENIRASTSLSPCVRPKIWVTIRLLWRDIAHTNTAAADAALHALEQRLAHVRENLRTAELGDEFERANRFRQQKD